MMGCWFDDEVASSGGAGGGRTIEPGVDANGLSLGELNNGNVLVLGS
jgi:hypothetical protein